MNPAAVVMRRALGLGLVLAWVGVGGCGGRAAPRRARVPPPPARSAEAEPAPPPGVMIDLPPPEDPAPVEAACLAGNGEECAHAARLYYNGWGVPRDVRLIAVYGALALALEAPNVGVEVDLAHLGDEEHRYKISSYAVDLYQSYVLGQWRNKGLEDCYFCMSVPPYPDNEWEWAVYTYSICINPDSSVIHGRDEIVTACLDKGDAVACRGWQLVYFDSRDPEFDPDLNSRLRALCRTEGTLCDVAVGETEEETARFREKGCLGRSYEACYGWIKAAKDAGRPLAPLTAERIKAEACLHPEAFGRVPVSVGPGKKQGGCKLDEFKALRAAAKPADMALYRALAHNARVTRASDCTRRFYDIATCVDFVEGRDIQKYGDFLDQWGAVGLPEEQYLKERLEARDHMCSSPPPYPSAKSGLDEVCSKSWRDSLDKEYKQFLASQAKNRAHP